MNEVRGSMSRSRWGTRGGDCLGLGDGSKRMDAAVRVGIAVVLAAVQAAVSARAQAGQSALQRQVRRLRQGA